MSIFVERMQAVMREKNLRQADICKDTGIGKSSMSLYLSGRYEPKRKNLRLIARSLGVDPDWLSGQDENAPTPEMMAEDALEMELLEYLKHISIPQKKALLVYVKMLASTPAL